jgi:hypothetical protein
MLCGGNEVRLSKCVVCGKESWKAGKLESTSLPKTSTHRAVECLPRLLFDVRRMKRLRRIGEVEGVDGKMETPSVIHNSFHASFEEHNAHMLPKHHRFPSMQHFPIEHNQE